MATKIPGWGEFVLAELTQPFDRSDVSYFFPLMAATERINSQAVELGIERPRLRNGQAIANQNTLTHVLINLRALQRIRERKSRHQSANQSLT